MSVQPQIPQNPYDQLTNINRGMPQIAPAPNTQQMRPQPPNLRNMMYLNHGHPNFGQFGQLPPGIDPRAVAANPQGYQQFLRQAQQQEQQHPGSTFLGQAKPSSSGPITSLPQMTPDQMQQITQAFATASQPNMAQPQTPGMGAGPGTIPYANSSNLDMNKDGYAYASPAVISPAVGGLGDLGPGAMPMQGSGFGNPTTAVMPTQNPYAQGQSSLSTTPQFGTGSPQNPMAQPLQSNNLMQQVGMK